MADISASMVKELRETTGLGMMECKNALVETKGDMKAAEDLLRIKSGAKANKAASRVAAEGVVAVFIAPDAKSGAMVEVNCETDFVAKNEEFLALAKGAAQLIANGQAADIAALSNEKLGSGTVEDTRKALVMKLGENMTVRRFQRFKAQGKLIAYLHPPANKIGVVVDFTGADAQLGKDIAMHIAAIKPICLSKDQVPAEASARERDIAAARAAESGKPANIVEKMVEGSIAKYLAEVSLMSQPFVKGDGKESVEKVLAGKSSKVHGFTMFVVGEGIEKVATDFAAEVAAMSKKD
ncbi:MAG: translation elongation factor Ts [Burkholderiales bacterium]